MGKIISWAVGFVRDTAIGAMLAQFVFPTAGAVVVGWLSHSWGVPIWVALIVGCLVLWLLASTANNLGLMMERSSAAGKLALQTLAFGPHLNIEDNKINALKIGVAMQNIGPMSLHYEVKNIRTTLDGRVNPKPSFVNKGARVDGFMNTTFWDDIIQIDPSMLNKNLIGEFEVEIQYWRPGGRRYSLKRKDELRLFLGDDPAKSSYNSMTLPI